MGHRTDLTYHNAIQIVLAEASRPLKSYEIAKEITKLQLRHIPGDRERQIKFINARISEDIKNNSEHTAYKRVGPGIYTLKSLPGEEYLTNPHSRKLSHKDINLRTDRVLVFEPLDLEDVGHFHGVRPVWEPYAKQLLNPKTSFFLDRTEAESTEDVKQIVSYVIVKYKDHLLRFTRGEITNVREFLFGEYSIGFGGHLQEKDWNLFSHSSTDFGYTESVKRELLEEINLDPFGPTAVRSEIIGVLNDDSTELGRRHFAFIHMVELSNPEFEKGEKSINQLELIPIRHLNEEFESYEYWSKLCIQTFFGKHLSFSCKIQTAPGFDLRKQSSLISLAGHIGSGKTEACTLLEREFDYKLVRCSRVMQKIIGCPPIEEIGRIALQEAGLDFITSPDGHERLALGIVEFMKENPHDKYVFDGLRYPETLAALTNVLGEPVTIVYIDNLIDNLFHYYQDRDSSETSFMDFLKIVHHPVERQIERFRPIADISIFNHGSLDSYISELRTFFENSLGEQQ